MYARYADAIHDLDVRVREVEVEPAVLAEDVVFLADDGDDRYNWWVRDDKVSVSRLIDSWR